MECAHQSQNQQGVPFRKLLVYGVSLSKKRHPSYHSSTSKVRGQVWQGPCLWPRYVVLLLRIPSIRKPFVWLTLLSRKGHHVVNGNFLLDDWHYLGEVRVQPEDDKIAVFPCELFHQATLPEKDRVTKFCFHYVSYSIIGTINTTSVFCLPAYSQGNNNEPVLFYQIFQVKQAALEVRNF